MSWSYNTDLENRALDRVRFAIGDTVADDPQLQDEELQYLIDQKGEAAAIKEAFSRLIAFYARQIDYTLGPESVKASQRYEHYKAKFEQYRLELANYAPPINHQSGPGIFSVGMFDYGHSIKR